MSTVGGGSNFIPVDFLVAFAVLIMPNYSTTGSVLLRNDCTNLARPARQLLKDRAYNELKEQILRGQLPPGTFMSERQLSAKMEMSKTPIRAALERLESEGLVRVSPQQGIVVREMTLQEMADQFEIRTALETYVVRAICGRLTSSQKELLETNLSAQEVNSKTRELARMVDLDMEFHLLLCEFLGNQEILRVTSQLRDRIRRVIHIVTDQDPTRIFSSYEEHRGIADAVLDGHADLAVRRLINHFEYGKQRILTRGR